MQYAQRSTRQLRLEVLENRCLLAGNVTAAVVNGDLLVQGDADHNDILIVETAQGLEVVGAFGTTVNGGTSFTAVGVTDDIKLNLGDGNDTAALGLNAPGDLDINLGSGDDAVFFGGFFDIPEGVIPTVFSVNVANDLKINTGAGNDGVFIFESQVGGDTDIKLGDGDDFLLIFLSTFGGSTKIKGGDGFDTFIDDANTYNEEPDVNGFEG